MDALEKITLPALQNRLKYFAARAKYVQGVTLKKDKDGKMQLCSMGDALSQFFTDLLASTSDPDKIRQREEFLAKAMNDPKAKQQLCAIRIETFNNYIFASQNVLDFFFEVVTLKPDERPVFQNTTLQEVKVYYNGPDGEPKTVRVEKDDQETLKNLHFLTTEKVRYKVVDVYRGNIVDAAVQTLRLAYDWRNQAEGLAFTLIGTQFGTFTFTGKKQNYPYLANSRINTSNLPTTNAVDIGSISSTTNFNFPVFDKIIGYYSKWTGSSPDMELRPTGRILVPAGDLETFGSDIVPTNAAPSVPAEKILQAGWIGVHYKGIDWVLIPDNTIAPGTCYPEPNIKPGRMWVKPSLDQEKVINTAELDEKNEEERYMRKVVGFDLNSASRRNLLKVRYRTP